MYNIYMYIAVNLSVFMCVVNKYMVLENFRSTYWGQRTLPMFVGFVVFC